MSHKTENQSFLENSNNDLIDSTIIAEKENDSRISAANGNDSHSITDKKEFDIRQYIHLLEPNPQAKDKYICPNCNGNDLSINDKTAAYQCYSGCNDTKAIARKCRESAGENTGYIDSFSPPQLQEKNSAPFKFPRITEEYIPPTTKESKNKLGEIGIETTYVYSSKFHVKRRDFFPTDKGLTPKEIWCHYPTKEKAPQETWNPYRADGLWGFETALWVEGEKCTEVALKSLRIPTTTTRKGSEKLLADLLVSQGFKNLVILPDHDKAGQEQAKKVKNAFLDSGINVIVLDIKKLWDNCPEKGDIADWLEVESADFVLATLEKAVETELKAKNKKVEFERVYINRESLLEVTTTVDETVLTSFFEVDDNWITINGSFYEFAEKSWWKHISDTEVERRVSGHLRLLYKTVKKGDDTYPEYIFASDKNKKSSIAFARSFLDKSEVVKNNTNLLGFSNGVLDTTTRKLLPHSKDYYLTYQIDGDYEPSEHCPDFVLDWLVETFGIENITILRALFSMYIDPSSCYGYFLHLIGQSGGGKGTFISLLQSLLPDENVAALGSFQDISSPEKRHQFLSQARLGIIEDVGGHVVGIKDFYRLVQNIELPGRQLHNATGYRKAWNCKFVIASVLNLTIENAGDGWGRRCIPIVLKRRDTKKVDVDLKTKLIKHRVGVLNWALNLEPGERDTIIKTATQQAHMSQAQTEQNSNSSSVLQFIDSCLYPEEGSSNYILAGELFKMYENYCEVTKSKPYAWRNFISHMQSSIPNHYKEPKQVRIGKERTRTEGEFFNIGLSEGVFLSGVCNLNKLSSGGLQEFKDFVLGGISDTQSNKEDTNHDYTTDDFVETFIEATGEIELARVVECHSAKDYFKVLTMEGNEATVLKTSEETARLTSEESKQRLKELGCDKETFGFPHNGNWIIIGEKMFLVINRMQYCYLIQEKGSNVKTPVYCGWKAVPINEYSTLGLQKNKHC